MSEEDRERRTRLPDAEAEGAGNFGAEPESDPTADSEGGPPEDVAIRSEDNTLTQPEETTPEAEIGNITGGETPEEVVEERADSDREGVRLEQEYQEIHPEAEPELERPDEEEEG